MVGKIRKMFNADFGLRLKKEMADKNYIAINEPPSKSQIYEFAKRLNVSTKMLRRYINGKSIPSDAIIEKISKILDIDPYYLLCGYRPEQEHHINTTLMKEIFNIIRPTLKDAPKKKYEEYIEYAFNIYTKLAAIDTTNPEIQKLITLMLSDIINTKITYTVDL